MFQCKAGSAATEWLPTEVNSKHTLAIAVNAAIVRECFIAYTI
jgi:hypothetical protein